MKIATVLALLPILAKGQGNTTTTTTETTTTFPVCPEHGEPKWFQPATSTSSDFNVPALIPSAGAMDPDGKMWVYGGKDDLDTEYAWPFFNHLYYLDTKARAWHLVRPHTDNAPGRDGASMVIVDGNPWIFGWTTTTTTTTTTNHKPQATSHQPQATSHKPQATNHNHNQSTTTNQQQPTANNPQPTTSRQQPRTRTSKQETSNKTVLRIFWLSHHVSTVHTLNLASSQIHEPILTTPAILTPHSTFSKAPDTEGLLMDMELQTIQVQRLGRWL